MNLTLEKFKFINLGDPFFDSLKRDYREFSDWFARKAEEKAYVFRDDYGLIDGFLYLKIEEGKVDDVDPPLPATRRVKVGTLKINAHGTKLGERFIKKMFDHAIHERVNEIYVTVFEAHAPLIALLKRYGFLQLATKTTKNGVELVLVKNVSHVTDNPTSSYPLIKLNANKAYLLSLKPEWHTRLLPDSILATEDTDIVQDISHTNSIHKVYLAAMRGLEALRPGDILLIYRTTDGQGPARYRSVATSVCVVEEYRPMSSFASWDAFRRYCLPYSVFSEEELASFWSSRKFPHVFRFTYNIAFKKRVTRGAMIEEVGLNADAYWGFMQITYPQLMEIARRGLIDESLIVY